jgi:hypothetical protein
MWGLRAVLCLAHGLSVVVLTTGSVTHVASGQAGPTPTFDRSPAKGKPGRIINVSGTGCVLGGTAATQAFVGVADGGPSFPPQLVPVRADGSWNGTYAIAVTAPPGDYRLASACFAGDQVFGNLEQPFTVLNEPPASVVAEPAQAAPGEALPLVVSGCLMEDASPASVASFNLADDSGTVAQADAQVDGAGLATATLSIPADAPSATYTASATCNSGLGDLVAAATTVAVGRRPLIRTG